MEVAEAAYQPDTLAEALGGLLRIPPKIDLRHVARPRVSRLISPNSSCAVRL